MRRSGGRRRRAAVRESAARTGRRAESRGRRAPVRRVPCRIRDGPDTRIAPGVAVGAESGPGLRTIPVWLTPSRLTTILSARRPSATSIRRAVSFRTTNAFNRSEQLALHLLVLGHRRAHAERPCRLAREARAAASAIATGTAPTTRAAAPACPTRVRLHDAHLSGIDDAVARERAPTASARRCGT